MDKEVNPPKVSIAVQMMGRVAIFLAYSECSEWHVRLQIGGRIKTQLAGLTACETATHFFS